MSSKVKIYTRTGDKGITSLFGGKRIPKNHSRIKTYGSIDELNSLLGIALSLISDGFSRKLLNSIQNDLFEIGGNLAGAKISLFPLDQKVKDMELTIDKLDKDLPELSNFILPQGTKEAAIIFYARAIVRNIERKVVEFAAKEFVDNRIIIYFNRLSDLFFILARYLNKKSGVKEVIWKP